MIKFTPIINQPRHDGTQQVYRFENGYGASVVRSEYSYGYDKGLFELGVITFDANNDWHLTYQTSITDDVIGHLAKKDVNKYLRQISKLPKERRNK